MPARRVMTTRRQRSFIIFALGLLFFLVQGGEAVRLSSIPLARTSSFWVVYTSYALISLLFYCIGSFCWLYAYSKQHTVTTLLFTFTSLMMIAFSTLSASGIGDAFSTAISNVSTSTAVLVLFFLLLRFPSKLSKTLNKRSRRVLSTSATVITLLCLFASLRAVCVSLVGNATPAWLNFLTLFYYILVGSALVFVVVSSSRRSTTVREYQQSRFFMLGTLLSFVPILGLTVVPTIIHARLVVDGGFSMVFLTFFPLTVGYAALRYNTLVFDSYVKKIVTLVVSAVGLALFTFLLFAVGSAFEAGMVSVSLAILLLISVLGGPCIWWAGKVLTERVFFPEAQYYKRILKQSQRNQTEHSFDVLQAAHLLEVDIMTTLQAPEACVFLFDEERDVYALLPPPESEAERREPLHARILEQLASCLSVSSEGEENQIREQSSFVQHLQTTQRPLFLQEFADFEGTRNSGETSHTMPFSVRQEGSLGPLLAPLRSPQGRLIGVIAISERGDDVRYGGPELEALVQLLHVSAMPIETARQFRITTRQQERTASELEEAYQQQRRLNEMKDQLIVHMSHELRTPLSEVSGYLALLHESGEDLDPELRTVFIEKAIHGSDELLALLSMILTAAQTDTPQLSAHVEDVALDHVLQQEVDHLDPGLTHQHSVVFQATQQVVVRGNEQAVRQIVRNLLSNAFKYSPANTTMTVSITLEDGKGTVCVKDEGPGITPQEMPLLFNKFVRLPRHHSGSIRGTGLGLFISRQMAASMDGRLWAESSGIEGEGSSFFLTLPLVVQSAHFQEQQYALSSREG